MKSLFIIASLFQLIPIVYGQSTKGITGIADTSYSVFNEYNKHIEKYPGLTVAIVSDEGVKVTKDIPYCSVGSRSLSLDVFQPMQKAGKKAVAIVIIHGGGWRSGNRALHYPLARRLAQLGYVCITPEYRLSTEALYPAAVLDIKAVVRWTRKHAETYGIDESKVVALGHSAGGELAAFLSVTNGDSRFESGCIPKVSSSVQAAVDIDGIVAFIHPESGEGDDSRRTSAATYWFGYSKEENPDLWKEASPLSHVNQQSVPTLFLNSSVDRMHAGRDDFRKVLDRHQIYSEVITFDEAPHSFPLFHPWFEPMVERIDLFLKNIFTDN